MATKKEVKKQIDLLPDDLMEDVYELLVRLSKHKRTTLEEWKLRDFKGAFDNKDVRKEAYEEPSS